MAGLLDGVLPALYSGADQVKRRVKGLLSDPREFMGQRSQDLQTMQDQDSALAYGRGLLSPKDPAYGRMAKNEPGFNAQQAAMAEQRLLDIAMQGLTVWHGSPHKFDKFDMSKIGTGEGAQAYGHGLYFAEKPEVAQTYADTLARETDPRTTLNGFIKYLSDNISSASKDKKIVREYLKNDGNFSKLADDDLFVNHVFSAIKGQSPNGSVSDAAMRSYKALDNFFPKVEPNLYKVDLPDSAIEKMLDWDKPLSQQTEAMKALKKARLIGDDGEAQGLEMFRGSPSKLTPEQLVDDLSTQWSGGYGDEGLLAIDAANGRAAAAEYLKRLGFPGIRYLDGGSRGAGTGTRNFVVFDDQLPKILEVNGGLLGR